MTLEKKLQMKREFIKKILFSSGIVLTVLGFSISHGLLRHLISVLPKFNDLLIGTLMAIVGVLMIAVSAKLSVSEQSEFLLLPIPKFNLNVKGLTTFAIAIILYFILILDLYRKNYSHWDILLFFSTLLLFGYTAYKLFTSKHATNKRLFNSTDFLIIVALISLVIAINLIGLTRWNFAYSGDEAVFFNKGWEVATGKPWNFFDLTVVYDTHPMLDSVYQGTIMKLFGINITGWRLSSVFVQAASAVLMYMLASLLVGRVGGILAGVVLGSSQYIMAFNRIAYNNTHTLFFSILAVLMLVLAWRTQKNIYVYLTGLAMGFCLYTFMATILIWIIIALVLLIDFCRHRDPKQVYAWVFMIIGFLLVITPALITTPPKEFIGSALTQTKAQPVENRWTSGMLGLENSLLVFWVKSGYGRYVAGPLIDVITQGLLLVGIAASVFFFSRVASRLAFLWFVLGIVIIAFSNYLPDASMTRLLFVLPAVALLSATGASIFQNIFQKNFNIRHKVIWAVFLCILILIPLLNLYQVQIFSPSRGAGFHYSGMILKVLQEYPERNIIFITKEPSRYSNLPSMLSWYPGFSERYNHINETEITSSILSNSTFLPIFLIYAEEKYIALNLSEKLPQYRSVLDYDLIDQPRTYLLVPKDAIKKETLTERILRIFHPFRKYEKYIIAG